MRTVDAAYAALLTLIGIALVALRGEEIQDAVYYYILAAFLPV